MYIQIVLVLYVLYMYITIQKHIFKEKVECCEELYWSMLVGKSLVASGLWFSMAVTSEGQAYGRSLREKLSFPLTVAQLIYRRKFIACIVPALPPNSSP